MNAPRHFYLIFFPINSNINSQSYHCSCKYYFLFLNSIAYTTPRLLPLAHLSFNQSPSPADFALGRQFHLSSLFYSLRSGPYHSCLNEDTKLLFVSLLLGGFSYSNSTQMTSPGYSFQTVALLQTKHFPHSPWNMILLPHGLCISPPPRHSLLGVYYLFKPYSNPSAVFLDELFLSALSPGAYFAYIPQLTNSQACKLQLFTAWNPDVEDLDASSLHDLE